MIRIFVDKLELSPFLREKSKGFIEHNASLPNLTLNALKHDPPGKYRR